jgi:hypothetical protein
MFSDTSERPAISLQIAWSSMQALSQSALQSKGSTAQ